MELISFRQIPPEKTHEAIQRLVPILSSKRRAVSFQSLTALREKLFTSELIFLVLRGQIKGMGFAFFQLRPEGPLAEIHSVVLEKEAQGFGYGEELIKKLLQWIKSRELGVNADIILTTSDARVKAKALYEKLGFQLRAKSFGPTGTNLYQLNVAP